MLLDEQVSPLSNVVPRELLEFFVGRDVQTKDIERRISDGQRLLAIVGAPGTGKTSLARAFAYRHLADFPRGVLFLNGSWASDLSALLSRAGVHRLESGHLIVLDEAQALGPVILSDTRRQVLASGAALIGISHEKNLILPLTDQVIELTGLSRGEFGELFRVRNAVAHGGFDERIVTALFGASQGNPVVAEVAIEAVRSGTVRSWRELLNYLRDFDAPGIVGTDDRPLESKDQQHERLVLDVSDANEQLLEILRRDPQLVWTLPPRRFEEVVADLLAKQGYEVSLTPASGDGGFDIYAAKKEGLGRFLYLVECKRYVPPNKVGVEIIRALHGVVQAQQATAGAIVTSSYFTGGAEKYQRSIRHQLQLHDYIALQKWLKDLSFGKPRAT